MQPITALFCQLLAFALVACSSKWLTQFLPEPGWLVWMQAVIAVAFSSLLRQPLWWRPIHLLFMPLAWLLLSHPLPSWLYLLAFVLLALVFWGTIKGDVPLFLSSSAVTDALLAIVSQEQADNLVELGAGIGSVVVPLAQYLPNLKITALENAPLPWLILAWRCRHLDNVCVVRKNLWTYNLAEFSLGFAFLSPKVMSRIGAKCRQEMPSRSLLISSSFAIPNESPQAVIELSDRRNTHLYCYRLSNQP